MDTSANGRRRRGTPWLSLIKESRPNHDKLGAMMKYFRSSVWIIVVSLSLNTSFAFAGFNEFDAAVLIKKSFWDNISNVLPMASVDLPSGKIAIVDSTLCESRSGSATFLVAFKVIDPQPTVVTQERDCSASAVNLVNANPTPGYDGLAFVSVHQKSADLEVAVTDAAVKPAATIGTSLVQEIRSYDKVVALQNIDLGDGSFIESADIFVNFLQEGLIVLIRDFSYGAYTTIFGHTDRFRLICWQS